MNNLIDFEEPITHPVDDGDFPTNLSKMPRIFRLTSIQHEIVDARQIRYTATLYHDMVEMMKVTWTTSKPDVRLKMGCWYQSDGWVKPDVKEKPSRSAASC